MNSTRWRGSASGLSSWSAWCYLTALASTTFFESAERRVSSAYRAASSSQGRLSIRLGDLPHAFAAYRRDPDVGVLAEPSRADRARSRRNLLLRECLHYPRLWDRRTGTAMAKHRSRHRDLGPIHLRLDDQYPGGRGQKPRCTHRTTGGRARTGNPVANEPAKR